MTAFIRITPIAAGFADLAIDGVADLAAGGAEAGGVEAAAGGIIEGATGGGAEAAVEAVDAEAGIGEGAGEEGGEGDGEDGGGCAKAVGIGAAMDGAAEPLEDKDKVDPEKIGEAAVGGGAVEYARECT